jgi:hypothetical protein
MISNWIIYVIEGRGSGHCHKAGLTVEFSHVERIRQSSTQVYKTKRIQRPY